MAFISHKAEVEAAVDAAIARGLEICGGKAESYAKQLCPVGTPESTGIPGYKGGTLRRSITHQRLDARTEIIGSNVKYAPYVELGTVKMKARPFLRPAAENHAAEYTKILQAELAKIK